MDLPASITASANSARDGEIVPDPTLFSEAAVFAAGRERIFARLDGRRPRDAASGNRYFRFDADSRSIIVTRDNDGRLHALRNVCIHAGYPVCDAEEGSAERLMCPYHGWEYALDGRLVEPNLSARIDPSRLRMTSYPICVRDGLLFVAPTASPPPDESIAGPLPAWLADGKVTRRECHNTTWNWKFMLNFVESRRICFSPVRPTPMRTLAASAGPLSHILVIQMQCFARVNRNAERSDLQVIEIASEDAPAEAASAAAGNIVADALRGAGVPCSSELDRKFFGWYWSLMSEA
jgi:nitrite reductase/ring-hydroxylating ferredoxin subunit